MAKNMGQINFGVGFQVNKASLNEVKKSIQELRNMSKEQIEAAGGNILPLSGGAVKSWKNDLGEMRKELDALDKAMEAAFNPKLGTYELNKFNEALKASGTSAQRVFEIVSAYGNTGSAALLNMTTQMLATDRAAKQVHSTFQKLGETMMNTIRWSITSTAINTVTGAIQQAYHYALDLDESLNDIMIVTDKSAEEMDKFARYANKAAKSLGASTKDYTGASLIYYQQGLSDQEVKARTETTLKAAAVTGQSASAVSEQLTAVWNGYKVSAEESELYIDKLAAVAAETAADLEELSTGMSKVASAANVMGVDIDQLNAQLATIVSVTRQAPESIGTALKTVYARMSDIEAGLDTETTLGEYTTQMAEMGINVLDAKGNLREMGDVVEEIGGKWNSLNREQQVSLAQSIAGTRQYNNMMALFDNWDMYQKALTTSMNSAGTLTSQHLTQLDSIEAHQQKLKTSAEGLYDSIFESDDIKAVYDGLADIVTLVDKLVQSMGGMPGILATVGMLFAKAAKNSIADLVTKQQANKLNNEIYRNQIKNGKDIIAQQMRQIQGSDELSQHLQEVLNLETRIYDNADDLTDDQWNSLQEGVRKYNEQIQHTIELERELQEARNDYNTTFDDKSSITYETYTVNGEKKTRRKKAEELVKGTGNYYLWSSEDDSINKKTGKINARGLRSARGRRTELEELKITKGLTAEQEKELKLLKLRIPQAEKENKIRERKIQLETENTEAIKKSKEATEQLGNETEEFLEKSLQGNRLASIADGFTSIAFSAISTSQSVGQFIDIVGESDATLSDYIGSLAGVVLGLTPLITHVDKARLAYQAKKKSALDAAAAEAVAGNAAKASGMAARAGAEGWKAFHAAMGPVGWIMLAVTAVLSIVTAIDTAQKEAKETAAEARRIQLEEANAAREVAEQKAKLTQSYLNAYHIYEKVGEEQEKLLELAKQLAEAYKSEELQNLALAGSYDKLAESIRQKRKAEAEVIVRNAKTARDNAITDIAEAKNSFFAGTNNVPGTKEAYSTKTSSTGSERRGFEGSSMLTVGTQSDVDKKNEEILNRYLKPLGYMADKMPSASDLDGQERIVLYNAVQAATQDEEWKPSGKLNTSVQSLLNTEAWKTAVNQYNDAQQKIAVQEGVIIPALSNTSFSSLTDFSRVRDQLIDNYMQKSGEENRDIAAWLVDTELSNLDSTSANLLLRAKWLEGQMASGTISETMASELQNQLNLDNVGETEFNALQLIDVEKYKNDADGLIAAARQKAKEMRNQLKLDAQEELIKASNSRIQELERDSAKAIGEDKIKFLQEQNTELSKQITLLEAIRDTVVATNKVNAQQEFKDLADRYGFANKLIVGVDQDWDIDSIGDAVEVDNTLNATAKSELRKKLYKDVLRYQNEYQEQDDAIQELKEERYQKNIEIFEVKLKAKLDTHDIQKEYDAFVRSFTEENGYAELVKLDLKDFNTSLQAIEDYKISLKELNDSNLDAAYKETKTRELVNKLIAESESLLEKRNSLEQTYLSYNDVVKESYEQYLSLIESANSLLEHQVELNELIYGDKAFKHMQSYYLNQVTNNQLITAANKERYEQDKLDYETLLKTGLALDDPKVQAAKDRYLESGEAYAASLAAQAQSYANQYSNTLENILDNFTKDMLDEDAMKEWDWVQNTSDMFLDGIEEAYEKSKLQKAFNKAINESSSLRAQQALNEAYKEELKMLKEKDKLTKYDLDRAQKRLDIEIARLALEDARDSKTQMRLMRQANGTYSYQYVADQGAIDEKQAQYENALKERYDADQGELNSQMSKSQQLIENFKSEISELNPASETYENDLQEIIDKYKPLLKAQGSNVSRVLENLSLSSAELSSLYDTDIVTPELTSSAVQQAAGWGANADTVLKAIVDDVLAAQATADSGIGSTKDTLDTLVSSLYESIMGDEANNKQGLLDAQKEQIQTLSNMSSAMLGVITTIGLLDEAIKIAKGDVETWSGAQGANTTLASAYDITLKDDGDIEMKPKVAAMDTGGYTGAWGSEGKFLLAHEKELILNKYDTANILSAVNIVRSLGDSMLKTVSEMGRGYDLPMAAWELAKELVIEQTVHINAEFPNVADRSEIEAAFEELMLLATQHAFDSTKD